MSQVQRIGVWYSGAGNRNNPRSLNNETRGGDYLRFINTKYIAALNALKGSAALFWCLAGRPDQGVDLDFDQFTAALYEGALSYQDHARIMKGIATLTNALPRGGALWYYLGMVEKSTPQGKDPFHPGRQWTMMSDERRNALVRQEIAYYSFPNRDRISYGFVIDSGAIRAPLSCSHKVASEIALDKLEIAAEPLCGIGSWMLGCNCTSFCLADTLAFTEDHKFDASFGTLPPSKTGKVHTALLFADQEEWVRNRDRVQRWWQAGCSIYIDCDTALARSGEIIKTIHSSAPTISIPAARVPLGPPLKEELGTVSPSGSAITNPLYVPPTSGGEEAVR